MRTGKGFAGMRKMWRTRPLVSDLSRWAAFLTPMALCSSSEEGGALARDIPWLYLIWNDRNREAGRFPGQG